MTDDTPTVLITGANRGIGLELVRQYLEDGWRVVAACRDPQRAEELRALGPNARLIPIALAVTDGKSVAAAARTLDSQPIDVLINNAGIKGRTEQKLGEIDYAEWAEVLAVNTLGPMRMMEAFAGHLERGRRRLAVNISSAMGSVAETNSGTWCAYRSSKAALNMVVKCAALELAERGITCVAVSPGWVRTDMGGPDAQLTVAESVSTMRRLFSTLEASHSGKFFDREGREYVG